MQNPMHAQEVLVQQTLRFGAWNGKYYGRKIVKLIQFEYQISIPCVRNNFSTIQNCFLHREEFLNKKNKQRKNTPFSTC